MELREHDHRLVRLETKVEMAQKDSSTNRVAAFTCNPDNQVWKISNFR